MKRLLEQRYTLKQLLQCIMTKYCIKSVVSRNYGIEVKDFGRSWRDGHAFNAMIHGIRPELVDMSSLSQNSNASNLENAFSMAETHLGIPRLIDPVGRWTEEGRRREEMMGFVNKKIPII